MISIDDDPQPNLDLLPVDRPVTSAQVNKINQTQIERENSQLQQELAATRGSLQATIEQQEFTNHALQIANEEILTSNEELQSINEELATSQEELQVTNEELRTINEELNSRNLELGYLNNDLQNLLRSINIPILMLDGKLRIRRFTLGASQFLFRLPEINILYYFKNKRLEEKR